MALAQQIEKSNATNKEAMTIAAAELARRLDVLGHAHKEASQLQQTYETRDSHDRDIQEVEKRVRAVEDSLQNMQGRLWLPMLVAAGVAAALAVAAFKLMFKN